ncbi:hypothetical protein DFH09DRAFT_1313038 [Mycena vulgaris]|nr:hypothetical protein DFH09DRAFT_1313038 [Mycena vulgaris]
MRAFLPTTTIAGLLLIPANMAAAQTDQQIQCLGDCTTTALTASSCNVTNVQNFESCACTSPAFTASVTQCGTSTCQASADVITTEIAHDCAAAGGTGSTPPAGNAPPAGKPNSAAGAWGYTGAATAAAAAGFLFYALLA